MLRSAIEPLAAPRRVSGLRKHLERVCYPDYDYKRAMATCPQHSGQKRATGLSRPWHGTARGKLVHEQMRLLVNGGGESALRAVYGHQAVTCDHLERFFRALRRKKLRPALSEFADFYDEFSVASAIDLICVSEKTGALSLVELKVGGENYFRRSTGALQKPASLRKYNNSPLHQAFLQLLFYRKMLHDHYPELRLGSCYVAQLCTDEVCFYRLPADFVAAQDELIACVSASAAARGTTMRASRGTQ